MPFLAIDIYRAIATYPVDYARAAAIGTLLFWISLIGVAFYRFASQVATRFVTVTARGFRTRFLKLRGWRIPAIGLILAYVTLAIILPYLRPVLCRFHALHFVDHPRLRASHSITSVRAVASVAVRQSIGNTLLVGVILRRRFASFSESSSPMRSGAFVSVAAGILDYITMFPIAVPGIVFGTGIFWTYLMTPVYGTIWILVIAFVASYIPFAYRMIDTSIIQIDKSLEEASALLRSVAFSHGMANDLQAYPAERPFGMDPRVHFFNPGNQRGNPSRLAEQQGACR